MKYRVRVDLSFEAETDAQALMSYATSLSSKAVSINEGMDNEEISFCDMELCRHDEGLPCIKLARAELKRLEEKPVEPAIEREPVYGIPATEASDPAPAPKLVGGIPATGESVPAPAPKLVGGLPANETDIFAGLEIHSEGGYHVFNLGGFAVRRKNSATGVLVLLSKLGLGETRKEVIAALKDMRPTPNRNRLLDILEGKK
jgi:hypothetical protein